MPIASRTHRTLLLSFLISIAACGLVGVYCLVAGNWGRIESAVLATIALVGAASVLGLAACITWERRRWHPIGPIGVVCVTAALALSAVLIWADAIRPQLPLPEAFWDLMAIAWVSAVGVPHAALLSLARLRTSYCWVRRWTVVAIAGTGALIIYTIVLEPDFGTTQMLVRVFGILAITVVCGTLAVPVLHRVSAIRTREGVRTTNLQLEVKCPRCQSQQQLPAGRSKCSQCGLRILIEIEEEQCVGCGYPLYKLESSQCPECGTPIASAAAPP